MNSNGTTPPKPAEPDSAQRPRFFGEKFWPIFFILLFGPAVFTFLTQASSPPRSDWAMVPAIFGSGISAILGGVGLALRAQKPVGLRILIGLFCVLCIYAFCFISSFMACTAAGAKFAG